MIIIIIMFNLLLLLLANQLVNIFFCVWELYGENEKNSSSSSSLVFIELWWCGGGGDGGRHMAIIIMRENSDHDDNSDFLLLLFGLFNCATLYIFVMTLNFVFFLYCWKSHICHHHHFHFSCRFNLISMLWHAQVLIIIIIIVMIQGFFSHCKYRLISWLIIIIIINNLGSGFRWWLSSL